MQRIGKNIIMNDMIKAIVIIVVTAIVTVFAIAYTKTNQANAAFSTVKIVDYLSIEVDSLPVVKKAIHTANKVHGQLSNVLNHILYVDDCFF